MDLPHRRIIADTEEIQHLTMVGQGMAEDLVLRVGHKTSAVNVQSEHDVRTRREELLELFADELKPHAHRELPLKVQGLVGMQRVPEAERRNVAEVLVHEFLNGTITHHRIEMAILCSLSENALEAEAVFIEAWREYEARCIDDLLQLRYHWQTKSSTRISLIELINAIRDNPLTSQTNGSASHPVLEMTSPFVDEDASPQIDHPHAAHELFIAPINASPVDVEQVRLHIEEPEQERILLDSIHRYGYYCNTVLRGVSQAELERFMLESHHGNVRTRADFDRNFAQWYQTLQPNTEILPPASPRDKVA